MKRITSLVSLLLLACLLFTSCTKFKIFENYNNIPDFEIESWGSGRSRIVFSKPLTFRFKFYWDAATKRDFPPYDDLLINIYCNGFDFKFRIVDKNGKRQT
ncbi:MAG: hypothetical protein II329_04650, partial [Clostridia bacterium]|nr:hypothetical protein [Clostridia bacterium]